MGTAGRRDDHIVISLKYNISIPIVEYTGISSVYSMINTKKDLFDQPQQHCKRAAAIMPGSFCERPATIDMNRHGRVSHCRRWLYCVLPMRMDSFAASIICLFQPCLSLLLCSFFGLVNAHTQGNGKDSSLKRKHDETLNDELLTMLKVGRWPMRMLTYIV